MGSFDGVHLAHKKIFNKMNSLKKQKNTKNIVITFNLSPKFVLKNTPPKNKYLLTPIEDKKKLIKNSGIDMLFILSFTKKTALISAEKFLEKIINSFSPIHFVMGYNHNFGYKRKGNINFIQSKSNGRFKAHLIKEQIPEHIQNDHPIFVTFLEKYYAFMDANYKVIIGARKKAGLALESHRKSRRKSFKKP